MSKVIVTNHVSLDGVMQGPGRRDEDTRNGFLKGGWAVGNVNDELMMAMNARVGAGGGLQLLLGRRSYESMLGHWNTTDSPFKEGLNNAPKYVASRTLEEPLPWPNSTLLREDLPDAVARLKAGHVGDLFIMGSGELIKVLMRHDLIDEYLLFIHPIVLGSGRRLFADGGVPASLRLLQATTTRTGVVIVNFENVPGRNSEAAAG